MTTQSTNPESAGAQFVSQELAKTEASLRRTRMVCVASVLFVVGYMSFITHTLQTRLLQPKAAADIATGYVSAYVQVHGDALSKQLVRDVPAYIAGLPDAFLAELPHARRNLENKLDQGLLTYAEEVAKQWGQQLDDFLVSRRDEVVKFVEETQNPQVVEQLGEQFEQEALRFLYAKDYDGQSTMDRLQEGIVALNEVEARLHRLAYADDLAPHERTLRQLIAVSLALTDSGA